MIYDDKTPFLITVSDCFISYHAFAQQLQFDILIKCRYIHLSAKNYQIPSQNRLILNDQYKIWSLPSGIQLTYMGPHVGH